MATDICVDFVDANTVNVKTATEGDKKKPGVATFSFDRVLDMNTTQVEVYEHTAKNIVDSVLQGFNGTIFAYGQTSSGKTFTMQGILEDPDLQGITPRLSRYLFEYIDSNKNSNIEFVIKASIIEIYNEKIKDLIDLSKVNLQIREDKVKGIYIESLSEHIVDSAPKVLELIKKGMSNRAINATNMNAESSRSHCIVLLNIIQNNLKDLSARAGKLYLVDLAGSEKISKTGATGVVLDEAKMINKSLTNLGHVINSLTDGKNGHVPYRDSKLTRVLQESLGGNSKTCLIITCSPSSFNEAETLSTLRFGLRAKKVKNQAKVNKEHSIQELKQKVNNLEGQLGNFKSRVQMLEEILLKNGLSLPGLDGDMEESQIIFLNQLEKLDKLEKIEKFDITTPKLAIDHEDEVQIINSSIIINDIDENKDSSKSIPCENTQNNSNLNFGISPIPYTTPEKTSHSSQQLNVSHLNENSILEINKKYIDVLSIVNELETEKHDLEYKLKSASERLQESNLEKELKESYVKQLEEMKQNSEKKAHDVEEKMRIMRKYMERNKQNLSLISEVDMDYTVNNMNDSVIKNLNCHNSSNLLLNSLINLSSPKHHRRLSSKFSVDTQMSQMSQLSATKRKTFNEMEIEYRPEICLEILKKEEPIEKINSENNIQVTPINLNNSNTSQNLNSFKYNKNNSIRSRGDESSTTANLNLLSTNPFSIGKELEMYSNSDTLNSKLHNNTPEYIGNVSSIIHFNTMNQVSGINNNQIFEDFMDKLKNYSDKVPEINNLIETYKEKLNINDNKVPKSTNCSKESDEEDGFGRYKYNPRRRTEVPNLKNNILQDIENKVEKVKKI
jgi:hypothetical protein